MRIKSLPKPGNSLHASHRPNTMTESQHIVYRLCPVISLFHKGATPFKSDRRQPTGRLSSHREDDETDGTEHA